jgi:DNA repair protein RadC
MSKSKSSILLMLQKFAVVFTSQSTLQFKECAWAVFLDRQNKTVATVKISEGGCHSTIIDMKVLFSYALLCNACGIVLTHNHPSGNLKPSEQDNALTYKTQEAAKLLDMYLVDHVIITADGYYSYAESGTL